MKKVFHIACIEYRQFVVTKTFIMSIILMPLMMGAVILVQLFGSQVQEMEDRHFAVVDQTGQLFKPLVDAANKRNRYDIFDKNGVTSTKQVKARYLPQPYLLEEKTLASVEHELSEKVRNDEIYAFVIIEEFVLEEQLREGEGAAIRYYSEHPANQDLPAWINRSIQKGIKQHRFEREQIDFEKIETLSKRVDFERFGLSELSDSGEHEAPEEENELLVIMLPMSVMMLLFICANMSTPLMLNSVVEEKMQKIAEILVSAVSPFELILGKLFGTVMVGLTLSCIYIGGSCLLLLPTGVLAEVPLSLFFWFFIFLVLTLLCFGSLWAGIGAACSQMKDAQNFTGLATIFIVMPVVLAPAILFSPETTFSRIISLIPPFTPFLLMMRIAIPPGVPLWEIILGLVLTLGFTLAIVWAGAKLFRIGLLWQGQTPNFMQLLRWLREK